MPCFWDFPYPSARMPVLADNVVATSQPLATQAGIEALRKGGNAVDAALSAAITLTVVEPTGNGIGGDAFAMIWAGNRLWGLNGSGRSPAAWSPERFAALGGMPALGWDTVTVPGAVRTWAELSQRFGRLAFAELFESAVRYAEAGFVVAPRTAAKWREAERLYTDFPEFRKTFLPRGRAPRAGERFGCADMATTLQRIAASNGEDFYRGQIAEKIARCASAGGGKLNADDLAAHRCEWVTPLATVYRDVVLHELPPNGQGIAALMAAGILDRLDLDACPMDGAARVHLQIEAMKLAFGETMAQIADPAAMSVSAGSLLTDDFLSRLAGELDHEHAAPPRYPTPAGGGTVCLAAADADGMMVSYIQSNYLGFGSGIVIPGTGISMQNRGCGFNLIPGHPNRVDGAKRPFHTIIPAIVTKDERPVLCFGVMGAHMQPQGHLQMLLRLFCDGLNPQAACDAPRWHVDTHHRVALEPGFDAGTADDLRRRGHTLLADPPQSLFGGAQLIMRTPNGHCAASDSRKDGQAAGY